MQSTVTIMVQLTLLTPSRTVVVVLLDLDSTTTLCLCRDVKIRNRPQIRTTTGYLYKPNTTESLTGHELSGITERIAMKMDAQLPLRPNRHSIRNRLEQFSWIRDLVP